MIYRCTGTSLDRIHARRASKYITHNRHLASQCHDDTTRAITAPRASATVIELFVHRLGRERTSAVNPERLAPKKNSNNKIKKHIAEVGR